MLTSECTGIITRLDADYIQVGVSGFFLRPGQAAQFRVGDHVHLCFTIAVTSIERVTAQLQEGDTQAHA